MVLLPVVASGHGASKSYADWTLDGERAELRLSLAAHDLAAAFIPLDADGDKRVTPAELDAQKNEIGRRVIAHTQMIAGRDTASEPCHAEGAPVVRGIGDPAEEIQVLVTFVCPTTIGAWILESSYLPELEPPHATVATVSGPAAAAQHVFTPSSPRFEVTFELPPLGKVLRDALLKGLKTNLLPAPLLFCLGLLLSRRGRKFAGVFSAFLLAHGLIAFLGGIRMPFTPLLIALAVAWVGIETFLSSTESKTRVQHFVLAVIFGALFGVLTHPAAPRETVPKIAFVVGSTGPLLLAALTGRVALALAGQRTEAFVRAVGVGLVAAGLMLAVLHFLS